MPTYVYKFVDTDETIEIQQSFQDDTLTEVAHPESGELKPVKKVFTPVGVTFKGSGFFKTDNRGKSSATSTNTSNASDTSGGGDSSGTKSSDTSKATSSDASTKSTSSSGSGESTSKSSTTSSTSTPSKSA